MPDFPRVLFLTPCAFNPITGGGVTFTNLFQGWPRDRLATVTDDPVPVSRDTCDRYFFLSDQELQYVPPLNWLRRRTAPQQEPRPNEMPQPVWGPRGWVKRLAKRVVGNAGLPESGQLSPSLRSWLADFQPDLVYTILGTPGYLDLLEAICRPSNIPFVMHIMDNGTIDPLRTGLFSGYLRRSYARRMDALVPRAAQCLAIGDAMAEEYGMRFGRSFIPFQNTIDLARRQHPQMGDLTCSQPARVMYIGSILPYAVLNSLRDCCRAIEALNRTGLPVQLEIYTALELFGQQAQMLAVDPMIQLRPVPRSDEGFFDLLAQADVLLLPVNFDPASVHYIRLSMPTKVPAYLASGVPTLVYGPPSVAQVEYARRHQWGHVVDQPSAELLENGLRDILTDSALRRRLSQRAQETATRFHDARKVRTTFQEALMAAGRRRHHPLPARRRSA
ncbi:hypothetical protein AYO44_08805 [Planctomycetaceae bacterium SCGC AG-212-F19]|nr:hypothetical protein AYO44_08805 [Planctomycetaceae bacterium SCGC AG-212-F19]